MKKQKQSGERKLHFRRRSRPGASPGTIQVDPKAGRSRIRVLAYGPDGVEESEDVDLASLRHRLGRHPVAWVNVDGLGDADVVTALGDMFSLHRLALEDVVNVHQRPKVEQYGDHQFVVARMASLAGSLETEQVSIFLGRGFLLTFQERPGDCFDPVRTRIRAGTGRIRSAGPDYLAYALIDSIVDHYFPVLEDFGERLENLEEEILRKPTGHTLARVHRVKRDLLTLRRAIWPQREAVNTLLREPTDLISDETRLYLRDVYDHSIQIMDLVETYRELGSSLVDAYLSNVSNRMNEVMKVLTIIATIFIPLTFVAGVYGMNFEHMPELEWKYGYPVVMGVLFLVAVALVWFFWRKGWLSSLAPLPEDERADQKPDL